MDDCENVDAVDAVDDCDDNGDSYWAEYRVLMP